MDDGQLQLADGRIVGFADFGAPDGVPVIWCHGGPGSRLGPEASAATAAGLGLRLIGIDRPGYGLSTARPGRTIGSWAPDALAVADHLAIDRFLAVGLSTGGAYAIALGALAPDRVAAIVTACSLSDLRWTEGREMLTVNRFQEILHAPSREAAIAICAELLGVDGGKIMATVDGVGLTEADLQIVRNPQFPARWAREMPEMFRQGVIGYADDRLADAMGWGSFDVGSIRCPTVLLHGEGDTGVPAAHSRRTATMIPGATLRLFPQHGHFSIALEVFPALQSLLPALEL